MQSIQGLKYVWKKPIVDKKTVLEIAARYNVAVPLAQTLVGRGYTTDDAITSFLFSSLEKDVASPALLKDAEKAVDRILYAIEHQEKILIFGDYDVDGITSSSLMMACLLPLGAQVNFYLPHRAKEGYGLSTHIVHRAADNGYKVIITVDNGTTAFEQALAAKERGIDLIITDHHRPHEHLPEAFALVNPHQADCTYPFKDFAGVGVTFKILSLLYEKKGLALPEKAYELLLLGTIADVVPLLGENRFWVRHGLRWIYEKNTMSLSVLKANAKITKAKLSATDIGFRITPQINALGRLEDARQGVKFLLGADRRETEEVGKVLYELNEARKHIERSIFEDVQSCVARGTIDPAKEMVIMAGGKNWAPGVIGLVASRVVGAHGKPVLLFHLTDKGKAKGSCRSVEGLNMFEALQAHAHLLDQFGGHAMAAGLALDQDKLPALKEGLEAYVAERLTPEDLQQKIKCDADITLPEVSKKLLQDMELFEPFGAQNAQPLFHLKNVTLAQPAQLLKDEHVKCLLFSEGVIKPVIFFNRPDIYEKLQSYTDKSFDVAVQVTENEWQGRSSVELLGLDIAVQ
jgi:single-stranded-DNA-specific exonuclease